MSATPSSYMFTADDDADQFLRATATYTDSWGSDKTASAALHDACRRCQTRREHEAPSSRRTAPDTNSEATTATRTVETGTAAGRSVGAPVRRDGRPTQGDVLTYELGGADADAFDIDPATGQIRTKAVLDPQEKDTYVVTVSVHDGFDASYFYIASPASDATIDVTLNVIDNDDEVIDEDDTTDDNTNR